MRFLVDAQLPPALARWLAGKGHEAEHVADRQMEAASGAAIWDFALRASAAIITKDEDFVQRKVLTRKGPSSFGSGYRTRADGNCSYGNSACRMSCRPSNGVRP